MLNNRYGTDDVQKQFFRRQMQYRNTMHRFMTEHGMKVLADNMLAFTPINKIRTVEELAHMVVERVIRPTLKKRDLVLPQLIGVNRPENKIYVYLYAGILKALGSGSSGVVDSLTTILEKKGCDVYGFVAGSHDGEYGNLGVVGSRGILDDEKVSFERGLCEKDGEIKEARMPPDRFGELFSRTFDSDIWISGEAFKSLDSN